MAPMVSAAIGINEYDCVNEAYLVIFLVAAAFAAAPGVCDDSGRYDCAIVSVTVTSHVTHLLLFHGINVTHYYYYYINCTAMCHLPRGRGTGKTTDNRGQH